MGREDKRDKEGIQGKQINERQGKEEKSKQNKRMKTVESDGAFITVAELKQH